MKQVERMIGDSVGEVHVDMGYRGHDYEGRGESAYRQAATRPNTARTVAMDETPRRGRTQHRTSEERTPVGAQSAEGRCRRRDQCRPGGRGHELPEAPRSFLARFPALPAAHLQLHLQPTRPPSSPGAIPEWMKTTFSGSTNPSTEHPRFSCCQQGKALIERELRLFHEIGTGKRLSVRNRSRTGSNLTRSIANLPWTNTHFCLQVRAKMAHMDWIVPFSQAN